MSTQNTTTTAGARTHRILAKKTININVYTYDELSDGAKAKARDWWREGRTEHYERSDEALRSLEKLAEHFDGRLVDYDIDFTGDYSPSFTKFDMSELSPDDLKTLLGKLGSYNPETLKGNGECVLTGYFIDEDAIDGLRIAYIRDGERDLNELMQAAFRSWLKACQEDCRYLDSDEAVVDTIRANEYEFMEDGKRSFTI